jgi:hypothetical protein
MSDIPAPTKRTLTEAQRLAFLKGREKRMANIEKKRLEKEEAAMASPDFQLPPAPAPTKTRKPRKVHVIVDPPLPVETKPEPEPTPNPEPEPAPPKEPEIQAKSKPEKTLLLDEDSLAAKIVAKLKEMQPVAPPPRKPRAPRRARTVPDGVIPVEPIPTNNFSWL